jgi:hypothetical protein
MSVQGVNNLGQYEVVVVLEVSGRKSGYELSDVPLCVVVKTYLYEAIGRLRLRTRKETRLKVHVLRRVMYLEL